MQSELTYILILKTFNWIFFAEVLRLVLYVVEVNGAT